MHIKEKIELLIHDRGVSKKILIEGVGMTRQGFDVMIAKNTITVDKLQIIANLLSVDVSYFFNDKQIDLPSKIEKPDNAVIEELRSTIEKANHYITSLEKDKDFLQDLVKSSFQGLANGFQKLSSEIADLKKHSSTENLGGKKVLLKVAA